MHNIKYTMYLINKMIFDICTHICTEKIIN